MITQRRPMYSMFHHGSDCSETSWVDSIVCGIKYIQYNYLKYGSLYFACLFPSSCLHNGIDSGSLTAVTKSEPFIVKNTLLCILMSVIPYKNFNSDYTILHLKHAIFWLPILPEKIYHEDV